MENFERVIVNLTKDPEAHALFLNSLSLMEYIGARKIVSIQAPMAIVSLRKEPLRQFRWELVTNIWGLSPAIATILRTREVTRGE